MTTMLTVALDAAERGWCVFPLLPGAKQPSAAMTCWPQRATVDVERIARWWRRHPNDNVAIACGPSALLVIDADQPKGNTPPPPAELVGARHGIEVLALLADRAAARWPPDTYTVATGRGGRHYYFRQPSGQRVGNPKLAWLVDTRGHGGCVVAAGSIVNRRPYHLDLDRPVAELPAWLLPPALQAIPTTLRRPSPSVPVRVADRYGAAALAGELQRARSATEGDRNQALRLAAWKLSKQIAEGRLDRPTVETALQEAGEAAGEASKAVAAAIRSALNKGIPWHGGEVSR
jgi:Bifunctional DNA primase/polymerase, N-terminal